MTTQYFTTGEVARIIGVKIHQIAYAIASGHIENSSYEFMNKRMWSETDLERLKDYFDQKKKQKEDNENEI